MCGTPAVSFATGGSPECINDKCGEVVPVNDIEQMVRKVARMCENHPFSEQECRKQALCFDKGNCIRSTNSICKTINISSLESLFRGEYEKGLMFSRNLQRIFLPNTGFSW